MNPHRLPSEFQTAESILSGVSWCNIHEDATECLLSLHSLMRCDLETIEKALGELFDNPQLNAWLAPSRQRDGKPIPESVRKQADEREAFLRLLDRLVLDLLEQLNRPEPQHQLTISEVWDSKIPRGVHDLLFRLFRELELELKGSPFRALFALATGRGTGMAVTPQPKSTTAKPSQSPMVQSA